ncbi:MAG: hypothetical protein DI528_14160 [Shinella sp.]|nr:MAG: hypothetical protein DI528_14160 [Shinella sp.]
MNAHWFTSLDDARSKMNDWRREYSEFRPRSAIGNTVPISLMNGSSPPADQNSGNTSWRWNPRQTFSGDLVVDSRITSSGSNLTREASIPL